MFEHSQGQVQHLQVFMTLVTIKTSDSDNENSRERQGRAIVGHLETRCCFPAICGIVEL